MSDLLGQTIGNYRIEERLGVGGMGQVFKARHIHLDRDVALKLIHEALALDPGFRERFRREARTIAALRHPNIVEVFDYDEQQGRAYMVMELITGGSLRSLLQRFPAGRERRIAPLVELVRQAAEGLAYAHSRGLIHRDIKPDNLLLTKDDRGRLIVKVGDFGLVRLAEGTAMTASGAVMGTPAYMSPEQCQGFELDARTDVYALGIVLYEATTGATPFQARTISEAAYKHVHVAPPLPSQFIPGFPPELERIILRCLEKQPDARYASAADLAAALRAFLSQIPSGMTVAPTVMPLQSGLQTPPPVTPSGAGLSITPSNQPLPAPEPSLTPLLSVDQQLATLLGLGASTPAATPDPTKRDTESGRIGLVIDPQNLTLIPGQTTTLRITLVNQGAHVDHFSLELDGAPPGCEITLPPAVQLYPGRQDVIQLEIRTPRVPTCRAGEYPITVRARSRLNTNDIRSLVGRWVVQPFYESHLALAPQRVVGRTQANYRLTLENTSNTPLAFIFSATDAEDSLHYRFIPEQITLAPGESQPGKLNVASRFRLLGSSQIRPFHVQMTDQGKLAVQTAQAEFVQQPLMPIWLPALLLTLLVIMCLGIQQIRGLLPLPFAQNPTPAVPAPEIISFAASSAEITPGQTITLSWEVTNAKSVEIDRFGTVQSSGTRDETPRADTDYRMTVVGKNGEQLTRVVSVAVIDKTATARVLLSPTAPPFAPTATPASAGGGANPTPTSAGGGGANPTPTWTPMPPTLMPSPTPTATSTTPTITPTPPPIGNRVLFYKNGEIVVGWIDPDGIYDDIAKTLDQCMGDWNSIVAIGQQQIFMYEAASGTGLIAQIDPNGSCRPLNGVDGFNTNWSQIAALGNGQVLFYSKTTGDLVITHIQDTSYEMIAGIDGPGPGYDAMAVAKDGTLLFYQRNTGNGVLARIENNQYHFIQTLTGFSPEWTHLIVMPDGPLLFYNSGNGDLVLARLDNGGYEQSDVLRSPGPNFDRVAVTGGNAVMFYNSHSGETVTAHVLGGTYNQLTHVRLRTGWKIVIGLR